MKQTSNVHLECGLRALREIEDLALDHAPDPAVCFHFRPADGVDGRALGYGVSARYWPDLKQRFEQLKIDGWLDGSGGEFGFELWERAVPSEAWLDARLPQMEELARALDHEFEGWTFEPRNGPIVSASPTVRVVRADSDEGRLALENIKRNVATSKGSGE